MTAYRFAECVLTPERRELLHAGQPCHLEPQVFDLLLLLIESEGRVVTKDEIIDRIWDGRAISDDALTSRIKKVRQAIGDNGRRQSLIRTRPRIGYQFTGSVVSPEPENQFDEGDDVASAEADIVSPEAAMPDDEALLSSDPVPAELSADRPVVPYAARLPSLVVMPFVEIGPSIADAFADGLVEEITAFLARVRDFVVVARQSAYAYLGRLVDAREVGRELGVRYAVDGAVRRCGDRVRISARLVDADSGVQIWSERFDDQVDDPFGLQDRIAALITGAVSASVRSTEIVSATSAPSAISAYDLVLRGLPPFLRQDRAGSQEALKLFTRAVEWDPDYALANAMRAWCLGESVANCWAGDPASLRSAADASATWAAAIGRDNASVLVGASAAFSRIDRCADRATELIDQALQIDPNSAWGWMEKGWTLVHACRPEQAIDAFDRASVLSPFDPFMFKFQVGKSIAHALGGDLATAVSLCERARRSNPKCTSALNFLSACYMMLGDEEKGRETMRQFRASNPDVTGARLSRKPATPDFVEAMEPFVKKMIAAGLPRK